MDHIVLKDQTTQQVEYEVDTSKSILEKTYHISVVPFAYPYGSLDKKSVKIVNQAGFSTAVSTVAAVAN